MWLETPDFVWGTMPAQANIGREIRKSILFAAGIYLAFRFVTLISGLILVLSVSVIFAILLEPGVSYLNRHRIPRRLSAALLAIIMVVAVGILVYLLIPPAARQVGDLWNQAPEILDKALSSLRRLTSNYPGLADQIPKQIDKNAVSKLAGPLLGGASRVTASAAGVLGGAFLILLLTVYIVADPKPITSGVLSAFGKARRAKMESVGKRLCARVRSWAMGVVIGMVFVFIVSLIGFALIGVKHAWLFALISGFMEAVPVVGPVLAAVPPILMAISQDPMMGLWVLILVLVIQFVQNNFLMPMIYSHQLSFHPITVILAVAIMGGLFGIPGVFLANPAASAAAIIYDEFYLKSGTNPVTDEQDWKEDPQEAEDPESGA